MSNIIRALAAHENEDLLLTVLILSAILVAVAVGMVVTGVA